MKKYIFITSIVFVAIAAWAFNKPEQESSKSQYVMVTCSTIRYTISIYYGTPKTAEVLEFRRGLNIQDMIVDTLNGLSEKGYELVSSSSHIIPKAEGAYNYTEFYYTLKLK